jgi:hypothetical protein
LYLLDEDIRHQLQQYWTNIISIRSALFASQ